MIELPLFPLNTVLFPGMPLPLHIFEERYQEMIRLCLAEKRPFGVVLIREGQAEQGPLAEPYAIGCTADIIQVQKLEDDRLFIMTVGQDRFRIHSLDRARPYLMGQVELLPLTQEPVESLQAAAARLYPLVLEYLKVLAEVGKVEFDPEQIPSDRMTLAFWLLPSSNCLLKKNRNYWKPKQQQNCSNTFNTCTRKKWPSCAQCPALMTLAFFQ